mmetsp:Transcript_12972/g.14369  ORF Transcript_12972/g.14369 Transcript_12972/m.14369 type:complete len:557 (+) Transcript_12972:18-1688(+)
MHLIRNAYLSDGDSDEDASSKLPALKRKKVDLAPIVHQGPTEQFYTSAEAAKLMINPTYNEMWKDVQGPQANPFRVSGIAPGVRNTLTGFVTDHSIHDHSFESQYQNFRAKGVTMDPDAYSDNHQVYTSVKTGDSQGPLPRRKKNKSGRKRKREPKQEEPLGEDEEEEIEFDGAWMDEASEEDDPSSDEEEGKKEEEKAEGTAEGEAEVEKIVLVDQPFDARIEWLVKPTLDYQGRSTILPAKYLKPNSNPSCFLPKKRIHTYKGHFKGVNMIRWYPQYGHLLFSAGLDGDVRVWEFGGKRRCVGVYHAHVNACKGIDIFYEGDKFASCGFDAHVRVWDIESGKCTAAFRTGKQPNCVKFYPHNSNRVLVGQADRKVTEWDIRSGKRVQVYDRHLKGVNTVTFLDNGRRFATTSDDKTIRVWDHGIPVDIKYIAEPHMHSMPATCLTPNGKWLVCQSLDNQIVTYSAFNKYRLNSKKRFRGHAVSGYACEVTVSPDMQYVVSGDYTGKVWFWDWKTCKSLKSIPAHNGPCMGVQWHPLDQSKVITCGWDGLVHLWD